MKTYSILLPLVLLAAAPGHAQTIDFGGLPDSSDTPFFGPYVEDGFSISLIAGEAFVAKAFGNPVPNLYFGTVTGTPDATFELVRVGGGAFVFDQVDLAAQNGDMDYSIEGFLGAASLFTLNGVWNGTTYPAPPTFGTFDPADTLPGIDRLVFSFYAHGTSGNIDNIVVHETTSVPGPTAVPEPATWAMMLMGFGAIGYGARRRRAPNVRFAL